jgi:hypothetical protein
MKIYKKLSVLLLVALIFTLNACKDLNEPIVFQNKDASFMFTTPSLTIKEGKTAQKYGIPVMLVATPGSPAATVNFDLIYPKEKSAKGHIKLLNKQKTLTYSEGYGYDTIWVQTIPDGVYTGNLSFTVILKDNNQNYKNGKPDSLNVVIADNEHPLAIVLGNYIFAVTSYFNGAKTLPITTSPVEGNITQIKLPAYQLFPGIKDKDLYFYIDVDKANKTVKMQAGQKVASFGYGPAKLTGYYGTNGDPQINDGDYISGTFDDNGTITWNDWIGLEFTSGPNTGYYWELYEAGGVMTKTKSLPKIPSSYLNNEKPKLFNR